MLSAAKKFTLSLTGTGWEASALLSGLGWSVLRRHIDAQKSVLVGGTRPAEVVALGQFDDCFERAVIDLHHQELAFGGSAPVRTVTGNPQTASLNDEFQVL